MQNIFKYYVCRSESQNINILKSKKYRYSLNAEMFSVKFISCAKSARVGFGQNERFACIGAKLWAYNIAQCFA